jgi:predicted transcriptional regulator
MKRKQPIKLTSGELDLMDLLWRHQRLTLADAHVAFGTDRIGYTTMQTRLNRLVEKGLAERSSERPAVYSPRIDRAEVQAGHLDGVLQRLTDGSVVPLVAHLVRDRKIDRDELKQLKRLVREAERDMKDSAAEEDA